jgi:hypothetical protein
MMARPKQSFAIATAAVVALVLSGCGGSARSTVPTVAVKQVGRPTPAESNPDSPPTSSSTADQPTSIDGMTAPRSGKAAVAGTSSAIAIQRSRGSNIPDDPDDHPPTPLNPCTLVNRTEAQAIVGTTIASVAEAPLGPSCIYRLGGTRSITLSVQTAGFASVSTQLQRKHRLIVRGKTAYCGRLGNEMLYVRLPQDRVLNVVAPCDVAAAIAAKAVARLES